MSRRDYLDAFCLHWEASANESIFETKGSSIMSHRLAHCAIDSPQEFECVSQLIPLRADGQDELHISAEGRAV